MKVYKLDALEYYTVAFSKEDAVFIFLLNNIGVTINNLVETEFAPNRDAIGKLFTSLEELNSFEIDY